MSRTKMISGALLALAAFAFPSAAIAQDAPLLNRVTESAYPTGSTFKPVTAFAALAGGLINPSYTILPVD